MKFLICIIGFYISAMASFSQAISDKPSWVEDFSGGKTINETYWNFHKGKFTQELEYYTDSIGNVFQQRGKLHICVTKDKREDKLCSSGRINTLGKVSFLYGKIEIKAKVPTGKGIFPAIWLLRTDHAKIFPLGEIDMMEYIDCFKKKEFSTNVHIVEKPLNEKEIRHKHPYRQSCNMTRYHIYGLEWYPDRLIFLLDGKEYYRLEKENAEFWPFDAPYYLILNVAMGSWGGKCGIDMNILPKEMLVDWIKYYKLIN